MLETAIASMLFKLTTVVLGILLGRLTLLWFDRYLMPGDFKRWLGASNDSARATYYGLRFVGICLLCGLVLG